MGRAFSINDDKNIFLLTFAMLLLTASCSPESRPDLGGGYQFDTGDGKFNLAIVNSTNVQMVGPHIRSYDFDSTFIIVSQQPWDDPSIIGLDEMNSRERDEAFAKSTFRRYWIINKRIYRLCRRGKFNECTLFKCVG